MIAARELLQQIEVIMSSRAAGPTLREKKDAPQVGRPLTLAATVTAATINRSRGSCDQLLSLSGNLATPDETEPSEAETQKRKRTGLGNSLPRRHE